jgi:hypothetical protein
MDSFGQEKSIARIVLISAGIEANLFGKILGIILALYAAT